MSALGEKALLRSLTDPDNLEYLVKEGIELEVIPTEALRPVVAFAISYYFQSGRTKAPSAAVLRTDYGDLLDDLEIDVTVEPDESVEWALEDLKGGYVHREFFNLTKKWAATLAEATTVERVEVVSAAAKELVGLSVALESRRSRVDVASGLDDLMREYEARTVNQGVIEGLTFGLDIIDSYTLGIHEGELAIMAAPPKTGKSYLQCLIALREWQRGRPTMLFTLENRIPLMMDRIACLACQVNGRAWQHGMCSAEDVEKVQDWVNDNRSKMDTLWVVQPPSDRRSIETMVREAQVHEVQSLLIDQLTFVDLPNPKKPRHERIGEALHRLHEMIGDGRSPMSCVMTHQINREGVKAAKKLGYLEMEHMAEAAEVERTADWVFGMFQSHDARVAGEAILQTLGARREDTRNFALTWGIASGYIHANREIALAA